MSQSLFDSFYNFFALSEKNDSSFINRIKSGLSGLIPEVSIAKQTPSKKAPTVKVQTNPNAPAVPIISASSITQKTIDSKDIIKPTHITYELGLTLETLNKVPTFSAQTLARQKAWTINYLKQHFSCFVNSSNPIRYAEARYFMQISNALKKADNYNEICSIMLTACEKLKKFEQNIAVANLKLSSGDINTQKYEFYGLEAISAKKEKNLKNALKTRHDKDEISYHSTTHYYSYQPLLDHCEKLLTNMALDLYRPELTQALDKKTKRASCWDMFVNWLYPSKLSQDEIHTISIEQNNSKNNLFTKT